MSGLLLVALAAAWIAIAAFIAVFVFRRLPKRLWRIPVALILFFVLIPLPLIDEIVGRTQFEQLCRENATVQVDPTKAVGKTVYLANLPSTEADGTWVRVTIQPWQYLDTTTGQIVVSYNTLQAGRRFFLTQTGPLTFNGYCAPGSTRRTASDLFRELGITTTKRPESIGAKK